jgi:hypothetical protein
MSFALKGEQSLRKRIRSIARKHLGAVIEQLTEGPPAPIRTGTGRSVLNKCARKCSKHG